MTNVAIVGASGYTALELARILLRHPQARLVYASSRQNERLDVLHPSLARRVDLTCEPLNPDRLAELASYAFLCLPHTESFSIAPTLRQRGVKVIDLSADYRLKNALTYQDWYGHEHTDPEGLNMAVYGLPELHRAQIPSATLIANPGCYTSTSILALAPLIEYNLIERQGIIIDAKSGVSGAGRSPKLQTHYPECNESLTAYNVGRHRHTPEIDQVLSEVGKKTGGLVETIFTPHLIPMDRGIFATIYATPRNSAVEHDLISLYREYYELSPFVRVVGHIPSTKDTIHTNFCDITLRVVRGKILVFAALDNLVKGASGVAIQNLNLMNGWSETSGLI